MLLVVLFRRLCRCRVWIARSKTINRRLTCRRRWLAHSLRRCGRFGPWIVIIQIGLVRSASRRYARGSVAAIRIFGVPLSSRLLSFWLTAGMHAQASSQTRSGQTRLGHRNLLLDLGQLFGAQALDGFHSLTVGRNGRRSDNRIGTEFLAYGIHHHDCGLFAAVIHRERKRMLAEWLVEGHGQAGQSLTVGAECHRRHLVSGDVFADGLRQCGNGCIPLFISGSGVGAWSRSIRSRRCRRSRGGGCGHGLLSRGSLTGGTRLASGARWIQCASGIPSTGICGRSVSRGLRL